MAPEADSPQELESLPVRAAIGLGQLGSIDVGETALDEFFLVDGHAAVGIELFAAPGVGEIRAVAALNSALPALEQRFAGRLKIRVVDEAGSALSGAIAAVVVALCFGVVAAFVVLLPSFRRPSLALVPAAALPATLVVVLPVLEVLGVSINLITLSGFVVGLGMVFDNAIMVTDRLLALPDFSPEAAAAAVGELGGGLFAATATTMIVLLPVLALRGTLGLLFGEAALVMLLLPPASLLSAVTLVPALCVMLFQGSSSAGGNNSPNRTSRASNGAIQVPPGPRKLHAVVVLGVSILGLAFVLSRIPRETLPQTPGLGYELQIRLPPGTAVASTKSRLQSLYRRFLLDPQLEPLYARGGVGTNDIEARSGTAEAQNTGRMLFHARQGFEPTGLEDSIRRSLPDAVVELRPRTDQAAAAVSSLGEHAAFIQAHTREELAALALSPSFLRVGGSELSKSLPTIRFSLQPYSVSNSGGSAMTVLGALQFVGEGRHIADIRINGRESPVRVFLEAASRVAKSGITHNSVAHLNSVELFLPNGARSLNLLGELDEAETPEALYRSNRQPALPVSQAVVRDFDRTAVASATGTDAPGAGQTIGLPAGAVLFVPEQEQTTQTVKEIGAAVVAALLLILLLLSAVFESLRRALLVLAATLPCVTAGLGTVWLTGGSINLGVGLGLIMLFGNAVNTSILPTSLMQTPGRLRSPAQAVRELGRGILFSTLSTTAALLPSLIAGMRFPGIHSYTALPLFAGLLVGTPLCLLIFLGFAQQITATSCTAEHAGDRD